MIREEIASNLASLIIHIRVYGRFFVMNDGTESQRLYFNLDDAINSEYTDYIDVFNQDGIRIGSLAHKSRATTPDDKVDWSWTVNY